MKKEQLKSGLILKFQSGKIDITLLSTEKLNEIGVSDSVTNIIDNKKLRLGSLGAYITFLNNSKDTISVTTSSIEITSISESRIQQILEGLKVIYPELIILSGNVTTNWHLMEEGLPDKILHSLSNPETYKTEVIRLRKEENTILVYQCGKDTLHVKQELQLIDTCRLDSFNFDSCFDFKSEQGLLNNFIENNIASE